MQYQVYYQEEFVEEYNSKEEAKNRIIKDIEGSFSDEVKRDYDSIRRHLV